MGLLAAAVLPAAVVVAELGETLDLIEAGYAAPAAFVLGVLAVWLARRGRRRFERTIGRVGGAGVAVVGRWLGILGICLALAGGIAIAFYEFLTRFYD